MLTTLLITLPIFSGLLTLYIVGRNGAEEPYGLFRWSDAIEQVGGAGLVVLAWLAWLTLVLVRRVRVWPRSFTLFWFLWGGLNCWCIAWLGISYFSEPWNRTPFVPPPPVP